MRTAILTTLALLLAVATGCSRPDVTIYCALDQVHSEPILRDFEKETGLVVRMEFDVEAVKTVGLTTKIIEEQDNPKCDVFWNNELVHTVRLMKMGLLTPYVSPSAADIPARFKDPDGHWTGFAARARVFILNTDRVKTVTDDESLRPARTEDLLDPRWKGEVGMAKPLAGTTLTHMSYLWATKGPEWVKDFWRRFKDEQDGRVATGNANLMRAVADGRYVFGYTDTDDFRKAELEGRPVDRIFPDQEPGGEIHGCLVIPNSVSLVKGGPHSENGKRLIDYILSRGVEERLAHGPSAQMPVRNSVPRPDYVRSAEDLVTLEVDWLAVADAVDPATAWLKEFFSE